MFSITCLWGFYDFVASACNKVLSWRHPLADPGISPRVSRADPRIDLAFYDKQLDFELHFTVYFQTYFPISREKHV
jgi:hypothetical protein